MIYIGETILEDPIKCKNVPREIMEFLVTNLSIEDGP